MSQHLLSICPQASPLTVKLKDRQRPLTLLELVLPQPGQRLQCEGGFELRCEEPRESKSSELLHTAGGLL